MSSNSQPMNNRRHIDAQLIIDVEKVLSKLGMSQTEALELYYNEIVKRGYLPFGECIPSDETLKSFEEIKSGNGGETFNSVGALMRDLND